jgi:TatD DNase family protein
LAAENEDVFFTAGLHPHDAEQESPSLWKDMETLARGQGAVAVGECGLDFFRDRSPRPVQRRAFQRQIELARELGLPLVIHDRDAHDEVLGILREQDAGQTGGVVHCFSGDAAFARKVLDLGFYLGVTGTITYPKNAMLREAAAMAPRDRLLIETDCPFLSPQPKRGKPNEPAYLQYTIAGLAQAMGLPPDEAARAVTVNAQRLFGLPGGEQ